MKSGNGKNIKKAFTYFIGVYFILSGVLISGGNVLAGARVGESCIIFSDCGTAGYGLNGALMKCDYAAPSVSSFKTCMYSSPAVILTSTSSAANPIPKEEYTPVKQVISADPLKFTPQIKIPSTTIDGTVEVGKQVGTKMTSTLLPSYIGAFYKYGLTVTGLLATVILMGGGIIWLTSAGNDSKVTQAKEMIFGSLAGVFLLFSSYIILETINPELVKLRPIESQSIAKVTLDIVCCQTTTGASMMDATECHDSGGSRMQGYISENGECIKKGCCMARLKSNYQNVAACTNSIKSQCPGGVSAFTTYASKEGERLEYENYFQAQPCSEIRGCEKLAINPCENAEDGNTCTVVGTSGYCYSGQCFTTKGKDGEPCGDNEGSICIDESLGKRVCNNRDHGGRSCDGSSNICCEKGNWK